MNQSTQSAVDPLFLISMIDNPLPDQVMQEKQRDFENELFKDHCYKQAKEICEQNEVFTDLIEHFQEWYHKHYSDKPQDMPNVISAEDVDLINTWWDKEADLYDDYDIPFDVDPTPQYLYDDTGGEPPISAQERAWNSLDSKRESHGHRYH